MVPVMQNVQPMAQPTCDETHNVRRSLFCGPSSSSFPTWGM